MRVSKWPSKQTIDGVAELVGVSVETVEMILDEVFVEHGIDLTEESRPYTYDEAFELDEPRPHIRRRLATGWEVMG